MRNDLVKFDESGQAFFDFEVLETYVNRDFSRTVKMYMEDEDYRLIDSYDYSNGYSNYLRVIFIAEDGFAVSITGSSTGYCNIDYLNRDVISIVVSAYGGSVNWNDNIKKGV